MPQVKKRFAHQRNECACTHSVACNEEFGNIVANVITKMPLNLFFYKTKKHSNEC